MKVTIKQIANKAGVSIATVSKIVNKKDERISQATRDRVLSIIEQEGYVPNTVARSMVTKRTKSIGLIIPDISNPFFPDMARGVEDYANEHGYSLILCNSDNDINKEEKYLGLLQEKMVDGIIITASSSRTDESPKIKGINIPIVSVDRDIDGLDDNDKVTVDNEGGAYEAVTFLLNKNYKKILHISGPLISKTAKDRYKGYKRAHKDYNIDLINNHLYEGKYTAESGYEAITKMIEDKVDFDSVFCGNDLIALGVYKAFHERNIKVPEDIGIVGFDDIYMAAIVSPELTTVHQPSYQMGFKSVELLINKIKNK